jgi:hypothetical protein
MMFEYKVSDTIFSLYEQLNKGLYYKFGSCKKNEEGGGFSSSFGHQQIENA